MLFDTYDFNLGSASWSRGKNIAISDGREIKFQLELTPDPMDKGRRFTLQNEGTVRVLRNNVEF
jgi:hypothetical protein